MKRGFTVIELLMVMAILAVLLGIITTAATASIRQSRERQAQAMKLTLQNGLAAYRARNDEWPSILNDWADKTPWGKVGYLSTTPNGGYDKVVQELLEESTRKNAKTRVMNPVGLSVIPVGEADYKIGCMDFRAVTTKNNKHAKKMEPREMTVVYPQTSDGKACRYVIEYNTESDEVTVMTQGEFNSMVDNLPESERGGLKHWKEMKGQEKWR